MVDDVVPEKKPVTQTQPGSSAESVDVKENAQVLKDSSDSVLTEDEKKLLEAFEKEKEEHEENAVSKEETIKPETSPELVIVSDLQKPEIQQTPVNPVQTDDKSTLQNSSQPAEQIPKSETSLPNIIPVTGMPDSPSVSSNDNQTSKTALTGLLTSEKIKKFAPAAILLLLFLAFILARNSVTFLSTGYAINGIPLYSTDYIAIALMAIMAFGATYAADMYMKNHNAF